MKSVRNYCKNNEGKTISKILIRADRIHVLEHDKRKAADR